MFGARTCFFPGQHPQFLYRGCIGFHCSCFPSILESPPSSPSTAIHLHVVMGVSKCTLYTEARKLLPEDSWVLVYLRLPTSALLLDIQVIQVRWKSRTKVVISIFNIPVLISTKSNGLRQLQLPMDKAYKWETAFSALVVTACRLVTKKRTQLQKSLW